MYVDDVIMRCIFVVSLQFSRARTFAADFKMDDKFRSLSAICSRVDAPPYLTHIRAIRFVVAVWRLIAKWQGLNRVCAIFGHVSNSCRERTLNMGIS